MRKILSGLVPSRRNSDHAVWDKKDLLFLCTWGERNKATIGAAYFEDAEKGLPQIKMFSCEPAVEDFTHINIFEQRLSKLAWPSNPSDSDAWHEAWASSFTTRYRQTIHDAHTLTVRLADEAKNIRDRILNTLEIETKNGYVHLLFEKFRDTLVHDMTEQQFADMYAQTVVYGLFSARCMDDSQGDFNAMEAVECIPNTNPFLKSLLQECLGSSNSKSKLSFDELEVGNIVELLLHTNTSSIITDFNRQTGGGREDPVDELEDDLPDYVWETEENLSEMDFDIRAMLDDTILDMEVLAEFIEDIMDFDSSKDDKIRELKRILTEDERVKNKKVIIFTEFRSTAKYIYHELQKAGFGGLYEIDGQSKGNRHDMVVRFSPYYNDSCSADVDDEIRILIATDVLAEGLNLQDASCLINYELHWNPVRLMQRIGRVDRRRNAEIEDRLLSDHPELAADRANAYYWNFLPPTELEQLLNLYQIVSRKALRISKTFGIEGKKLLTPEDDFDALKEFNSQYEGETSWDEKMALAYQELLATQPDYPALVETMPKKMYSGKQASTFAGFFFCYELPMKRTDGTWTDRDGWYRWYLLDPDAKKVIESTYDVWKAIQCTPDEPRKIHTDESGFSEARKIIENYLKKNYMRSVQAPLGVRPRLVTWMELC